MHSKLIISILSLISAFCLFSITCAGEMIPDPVAKSGKAVLRPLHSEDIRRIMGRLYTLAYEREYTELELDRIRQENLEALALAATDLVKIAEQLPQLLPDNQLSDEEQVTFKAMANQLHNETLHLLNTDSSNSYSELKSGYRRLRQTCAACHNLFRDW